MPRPNWTRLFERLGEAGRERLFDTVRDVMVARPGDGPFRSQSHRVDNIDPVTAAFVARTQAVSPQPPAPVFDLGNLVDPMGIVSAGASIVVGPVSTGRPVVEAPAAPAPETPDAVDLTTGSDNIESVTSGHAALVFGAMLTLQGAGTQAPPFGSMHDVANYVVAYSDNFGPFQDAIVYDKISMTLLTGGPGDWPELGAGPDDTLVLDGDFSAGSQLPSQPGLDTLVLNAGHDYNLVANDNDLDAGDTLTVNAMPLGDDNHVMFDGSAESDGNFDFFGSQSGDFFFGGEGDDLIRGMAGADSLTGGGGSDIFVYTGAGDSSGTDYDTIAGFDPNTDRIDLPGGVTSFADPIQSGSLSYATFNDDLAAALGTLAPTQAVWFAPDAGDLAGQIFLIVDGNGQAGYQEGEDYVIAVAGTPLVDLTGHTDIFI